MKIQLTGFRALDFTFCKGALPTVRNDDAVSGGGWRRGRGGRAGARGDLGAQPHNRPTADVVTPHGSTFEPALEPDGSGGPFVV